MVVEMLEYIEVVLPVFADTKYLRHQDPLCMVPAIGRASGLLFTGFQTILQLGKAIRACAISTSAAAVLTLLSRPGLI